MTDNLQKDLYDFLVKIIPTLKKEFNISAMANYVYEVSMEYHIEDIPIRLVFRYQLSTSGNISETEPDPKNDSQNISDTVLNEFNRIRNEIELYRDNEIKNIFWKSTSYYHFKNITSHSEELYIQHWLNKSR